MSGTREQQEQPTTEVEEDKVLDSTAEEVEDEGEGNEDEEGESSAAKTEGGKKEKPWFQKRIDEVTAEKWSARREADAAKARAAELERQLASMQKSDHGEEAEGDKDGGDKRLTQAEIDRLAEEKAALKVRVESFNKACEVTFDKGKEAFEDFEDVLANYRDLGGLTQEFVEAALETDVPHRSPSGPQGPRGSARPYRLPVGRAPRHPAHLIQRFSTCVATGSVPAFAGSAAPCVGSRAASPDPAGLVRPPPHPQRRRTALQCAGQSSPFLALWPSATRHRLLNPISQPA